MSTDNEKKFVRLFMFAHKVCLPVVRAFFKSNVLNGTDYDNDFIKFLEKHKHELYHLMETVQCCQCQALTPVLRQRFKISMKQFKSLYTIGPSISKHFQKGSDGCVLQQCLCGISVVVNCKLEQIDLSFLHSIINHCVSLQYSHEMWLDTINEQRNKICHTSEINALTESKIETMWGKLESSVLALVEDIKPYPEYKEMTEMQIETFKEKDFDWNTVKPLLEAMQSEFKNNINGLVQSHHGLATQINTHVERLSEENKTLNEKLSNHISSSNQQALQNQENACNRISAQVATCHSENIKALNAQKDEIKLVIEDVVQKEFRRAHMQHQYNELKFDVEIKSASECNKDEINEIERNCTQDQANASCLESSPVRNKGKTSPNRRCVIWKIETRGYFEKEKENIKQTMQKHAELMQLTYPVEIQYVQDGSITIGTVIPVDIIFDQEKLQQTIRQFLTQMVTTCNIDTSEPLTVKVKIIVFDDLESPNEAYVKCAFTDETALAQCDDVLLSSHQAAVKSFEERKILETKAFVESEIYIPGTFEKEVQTDVAEIRHSKKPLSEFDVIFINGDINEEIIWVAKASAYLEEKCGLKCAIPARDYMYGVSTQDDIKNYIAKCNLVVLTCAVVKTLGLYRYDYKHIVVLTDDLEKVSKFNYCTHIEVSTCEHIWLSYLVKTLQELSPNLKKQIEKIIEDFNYEDSLSDNCPECKRLMVIPACYLLYLNTSYLQFKRRSFGLYDESPYSVNNFSKSGFIFLGTGNDSPWILATLRFIQRSLDNPDIFKIRKVNEETLRAMDHKYIKGVFCVVSKDAGCCPSLESYIEYIMPKVKVQAIWITTEDIEQFNNLPRITATGSLHGDHIEELLKILDNHLMVVYDTRNQHYRSFVIGMATESTKIVEIAKKILRDTSAYAFYEPKFLWIEDLTECLSNIHQHKGLGIIVVSKAFPTDILEKINRSQYDPPEFVMIEKIDMPDQISFIDATGDENTWLPLFLNLPEQRHRFFHVPKVDETLTNYEPNVRMIKRQPVLWHIHHHEDYNQGKLKVAYKHPTSYKKNKERQTLIEHSRGLLPETFDETQVDIYKEKLVGMTTQVISFPDEDSAYSGSTGFSEDLDEQPEEMHNKKWILKTDLDEQPEEMHNKKSILKTVLDWMFPKSDAQKRKDCYTE